MRALLVLFVIAVSVRSAAAHMVVVPAESKAGGWERYSLIVPTEKESATVRLELKLPPGIEVMVLESKPGWKGVHSPFPLGAARLEWSGGRIPPDEFLTFGFMGLNPKTAQTITWEATQWYEDGSSDRWATPGDEKRPASQTTLRPPDGGADHALHRPAMEGVVSPQPGAEKVSQASAEPATATMLSVASLAVSLVALVVAARARRRGASPR